MTPDDHPVDADTEVLVGGVGGHPAGESVYHLSDDCGAAPRCGSLLRPDDRLPDGTVECRHCGACWQPVEVVR